MATDASSPNDRARQLASEQCADEQANAHPARPRATYTYDGLDRLLTADEGGLRTRYRYVGQTTAVAQTVNDVAGVPIRSIGTD